MSLPDLYELTKEMERTHGREAAEQMWREIAEDERRRKEEGDQMFDRFLFFSAGFIAGLILMVLLS